MADIMKQFIRHMEGTYKARQSDAAAKAIAKHCDARIAKLRKAIAREEKYLFKLLRARNTGGIMAGDIEGAFQQWNTRADFPRELAERVKVLGDALTDILEYSGHAPSALYDPYVVERARAALSTATPHKRTEQGDVR
jgi:hypothetical protein